MTDKLNLPQNKKNALNAALQEEPLRICLSPEGFTGLSKEKALEKAMNCFYSIEELVEEQHLGSTSYLYSKAQNYLYSLLNNALLQGQHLLDIIEDVPAVKFSKLTAQLEPPPADLVDLFTTKVIPFLAEGQGNASLTMSVGPGSEIPQMFPHDEEYKREIYNSISRNVIFVIEGGEEGVYGNDFTSVYSTNNVKQNEWFSKFLTDLYTTFGVAKDSVEVNLLPPIDEDEPKRLLTAELTLPQTKTKLLFVFYKNDYKTHEIVPIVNMMIPYTRKNILICGIRTLECTKLFFQDSSIYLHSFHFYTFVHGDYTTPNMKTKDTSFRVDLNKMKTNGMTHENVFSKLTLTPEGQTAMGYTTSALCSIDKKYCVQGNKNNNGSFWKGLGGKKRRTKRKVHTSRKTRRSKSRS